MVPTRVIPCLLLRGSGLVKTVKFKDPRYLGDPRNTVKIFNEKEVDELVLLDILATPEDRPLQFDLVREIVSEAFMPLAYGGGLRTLDDCRQMLQLGVEKVVINSHAVADPSFITKAASEFGSQSVVVALDVRRSIFGRYEVLTCGGRKSTDADPITLAQRMAAAGAGELIITAIDRDGTMQGYDLQLVRSVSDAVDIPVVACGGAGTIQHLAEGVRIGRASAVAAGSMFVFQGKHRAVLISFPAASDLRTAFEG